MILLPLAGDLVSVEDEVNRRILQWRSKAMTVILTILVIISLPKVILLHSPCGVFSWGIRFACIGALLLLALAAWRQDWDLRWRAAIFFIPAISVITMQLIVSGLDGSGRITLIWVPLLALVLFGNTAGWLMAGLCVVIYWTFAGCCMAGILNSQIDISNRPGFVLFQGVILMLTLIPLLLLCSRHNALMFKIMLEESQSRRKIEQAAAEQQRLEKAITSICEEEQRRLGSELHDGLCQHLTAALLTCMALENDLTSHKNIEHASVTRLRHQLEDSIGMAYDTAKGLCPVGLDPRSLATALQRLGDQLSSDFKLSFELRADELHPSFTQSTMLHIYRIAQEALTNAVKHGQCTRLRVDLLCEADGCLLRVADNGQKKAVSPSHVGGLGIHIMNYRAKTIGARFWIEHPSDGGTVVNCRVPLNSLSNPV